MTQSAFTATFSDWKVIKTRGTVQLVFEIPIEKADEAYQVLGGMPIAAHERWCAIARLSERKEKADGGHGNSDNDVRVSDRDGSDRRRGDEVTATQPPPPQRIAEGEAERRKFGGMPYSTQAALRSRDAVFRAFLREMCGSTANNPDQAEEWIKGHCRVNRKREILPGTEAETYWLEIENWFAAWKTKERAMA